MSWGSTWRRAGRGLPWRGRSGSQVGSQECGFPSRHVKGVDDVLRVGVRVGRCVWGDQSTMGVLRVHPLSPTPDPLTHTLHPPQLGPSGAPGPCIPPGVPRTTCPPPGNPPNPSSPPRPPPPLPPNPGSGPSLSAMAANLSMAPDDAPRGRADVAEFARVRDTCSAALTWQNSHWWIFFSMIGGKLRLVVSGWAW